MRITVYYSPDADKCTELEVEPSDTVKSVKQKVIALYAPPEWANTALLALHGSKDYFDNKKRLAQCKVQQGDALKFSYARTLTQQEKLQMNMQGIETEEFPLADEAHLRTMPAMPLPY
mmetsp:Transcript_8139/g.16589  ORF Transcript_8139/g.16589 Transcript_8139/m.16589 type:complete len:118 (-) Transcript_8139:143-496(-)